MKRALKKKRAQKLTHAPGGKGPEPCKKECKECAVPCKEHCSEGGDDDACEQCVGDHWDICEECVDCHDDLGDDAPAFITMKRAMKKKRAQKLTGGPSGKAGAKGGKGPEPCEGECEECKPKCEARCNGDNDDDCHACVYENQAECAKCAACHDPCHDDCKECIPLCAESCTNGPEEGCKTCIEANFDKCGSCASCHQAHDPHAPAFLSKQFSMIRKNTHAPGSKGAEPCKKECKECAVPCKELCSEGGDDQACGECLHDNWDICEDCAACHDDIGDDAPSFIAMKRVTKTKRVQKVA